MRVQIRFREMERECLDLTLRREYLKTKMTSLRKGIDFYRSSLLRVVIKMLTQANTYDIDIDS